MNPGQATRLSRRAFGIVETARAVLERAGVRQCRVLAGVSGGGDSMALLEILLELAGPLELDIEVCCIDHGLRTETPGEQALVAQTCTDAGLTFHLRKVTPGDASEDACRRVRHQALAQVAAERGCRWTLLAHSADDQIETVLLRFLRGAGLGGLAAMNTVSGQLVRPLLGVRRTELRELLRQRGRPWAEDPTNLSERYARGRLRTVVIPALERAFGSGALGHLLDSVRHWRRDHLFLERETNRLEAYCLRTGQGPAGPRPELDLIGLKEADDAIRARVLHRWLARVGGLAAPDASYVEQLLTLVDADEEEKGMDLPGVRVWCEDGRLRSALSGADWSLAESADGATDVLPPAEGRVRLRRVKKNS